MKKLFIISALCCLAACSSSSSKTEDDPENQPKNVYHNPVINYSLPDPSVIRGEDGYFYLYATENIRNLPIHRSKNLVPPPSTRPVCASCAAGQNPSAIPAALPSMIPMTPSA